MPPMPSAPWETDDADRMPYGCDTFDTCPVGDRDIMSDEWEAACGRPRCGGRMYDEYGRRDGCPGCRHCEPPDHECKPYGWGIERFEREDILSRARQLIHWWGAVSVEPLGWQRARELAFRWSGYDAALERQSKRAWDALCDCCETHGEAAARYAAWCERRGLRKRPKS
jgi:hypothetical protein